MIKEQGSMLATLTLDLSPFQFGFVFTCTQRTVDSLTLSCDRRQEECEFLMEGDPYQIAVGAEEPATYTLGKPILSSNNMVLYPFHRMQANS